MVCRKIFPRDMLKFLSQYIADNVIADNVMVNHYHSRELERNLSVLFKKLCFSAYLFQKAIHLITILKLQCFWCVFLRNPNSIEDKL